MFRNHRLLIAIIFFIWLIPLPLLAVSGREWHFTKLEQERGVIATLEQVELHLAAGVVKAETVLQLDDFGQMNELAQDGKITPLPKRYRSNQQVYYYSFNQPLAGDLIVRLRFDQSADTAEQKQKRIFFTTSTQGEWQKLYTVLDNAENYTQATLLQNSGYIVLTTHRFNKVAPIKKSTFQPYPGTLYADTAAVMDVKSGKFLYRQEATKQRSIASLTKLITTMIFLESHPNFDALAPYQSAYDRLGAGVALEEGEQISLKQVLMGTLIPSANNMAVMLMSNTPYTAEQFMLQAKGRLAELGLKQTVITEPTGLNSTNVSSAGNITRLALELFTQYPEIFLEAAESRQYHYFTANTQREITLYTTNDFNGQNKYAVSAFKTGYLPGTADRTVVMLIQEIATGHEIIVTLLGNPQYGTIFDEVASLADWTFQNWEFHNY